MGALESEPWIRRRGLLRLRRVRGRTRAFVVRRPWLVPGIAPLGLLLWAALWHRVLAPGDGRGFYLPLHELAAEALRAGQMPAWNPFQFAGAPLLATAQPAPFYPLEAAFLVLPAFVANNLYVVCNFSVAAVGTFFFAHRLTRDRAGACIAALAFGSSGFMYGHIAHQSVVAAAGWLPWTLYGFERLRERVDPAGVVALAAPLAASFLAGQPQMSVLIVIVLALYAVAQLVLAEPRARRLLKPAAATLGVVVAVEMVAPYVLAVNAVALAIWVGVLLVLGAAVVEIVIRRRPRAAWAAILAIVAAAGAAAVQLVPVISIVGDTSRASFSYADATSFSFPASHVILVLVPQLFGSSHTYHGQFNLTELSAYPGAAAIVLGAAGLARARRDDRFVALSIAAAFAFVAALGHTTVFGLLVWATPILGHFRSWGRYAVVLDLAVAVCAAYGVAALRSRVDRAVRRAALAAGALVAISLLVPLLPRVAKYAVSGAPRLYAVLPPICAAAAAVGCVALFRTRPALAVAACALVVVADGLVSFGIGSELASSPTVAALDAVYSPTRTSAWGPVAPAAGGVVRYMYLGRTIEPAEPYFPQATDLKGLRSGNGYDPLAPSAYLDTVGMRQDGGVQQPSRLLKNPGWTLDLLRVSTVLVPASERPSDVSPRYTLLGAANGVARYRYIPRLADAFLVGRAQGVPHSTAVAAVRGATRFDPRREALLEDCAGCTRTVRAGAAGVVRGERRKGGEVTLDVVADRAAALVVSEAWFRGWRASVDGHPARVMRADGLLLGVLIPPGPHQVRLHYVAPGATTGAAISTLFLLSFAVVPAGALVRRRRVSARRR